MPIYLPRSDMESMFRKAFMLTVSFLLASVGFSLSVVSFLLGIFFPDIQERPPRRKDPIRVSKRKKPRQHQVRDTTRSRERGLVTEEARPVFNLLVQPIDNVHDSDGPIVTEPTERGRSETLMSDAPNPGSSSPPPHSRASMSPSEYSERSESSAQIYDFPTASSEESSPLRNSHVHGFRIGRAWKKSKSSIPMPSPMERSIVNDLPTIKKSKTFHKSSSMEKKGICKARSFCVIEREKNPKVPSPRPRTHPYEAPYFTPLPGSGPVLSVPKAKQPSRSSTLPPPSNRRATTTPPLLTPARTT
ncbi:uncharacterized protein EV420DRAFT_1514474 [Desarmillaria tabescens]|uniref:Uncharacterized protein n=1 Tax=Armillaria tabescens TaxID=1929756 RepID=A0AA39TNV8_ARMTA|nr:uncharacterized protein EV420DRAFT_1514474 [Desarmillaria tabescens]KAK0465462.1 hypothetical protein EV420DRAFT_1514474 [Desarmillaria tabescens]